MANHFSIQRELLESPMWLDETFSRGQAWVDLIGLARWKDGHVRIRGIRIELSRGELAWSELKLAERWKWSRGKVRRFLKELKSDEKIEQRPVQRGLKLSSIISIQNYDKYQSTVQRPEHQTDIKRTSNGTGKNKENKEKKENNVSQGAEIDAEIWGFDLLRTRPELKRLTREQYELALVRAGIELGGDSEKKAAAHICDKAILMGQIGSPGTWIAVQATKYTAPPPDGPGLIQFPKKSVHDEAGMARQRMRPPPRREGQA